MEGEKVKAVTGFILLVSKVTADGDCRHEIKRYLLLGRKAMTNLDSILKSRDINLLTEVHLVKTLVFPVVMCGCESWIIKKAWVLKSWCFQIVVLEKTLVPWTARSKQSILKEINPEYSLEGLLLKLKLQATWYEEPTHWKRPWWWQRLKAKGEGGGKGWDSWIASPTQGTWIWANCQEMVKDPCPSLSLVCCSPCGHKESDTT